MKLRRILVPIDFSAHSMQALDYAAGLSEPFGAQLAVLFVVEPIYYAVPDFAGATAAMGGLLEEQKRSGREQLRRLERRYEKRGIALRALLQTGSPAQAIVDAAAQLKVDMIVMSTHGRTGVSHLLMGSVAERVVRTAACPVLTVHGRKGVRAAARPRRARRAPRAKKPRAARK
jgi:nucleotide-binding universal stress UspA family protein